MPPHEWPVVFRPRTGEVLSSWIARIAGVYHLKAHTLAVKHLGWPPDALIEIDLSPPERIIHKFSQLARLSPNTVEHHTIRGANPAWLPDWVTLQTPGWHTTERRHISLPGVLFNVCPACLHEDLSDSGQFIRMNWLCAAATICDKHFIPLRACFDFIDPPFECCHGPTGPRFYRAGRDLLDSPFNHRQTSKTLALLSEFEQTLKLALTARAHLSEPPLSTSVQDEQLISVVEDLTWALLQIVEVDGTRLVHYFQTEPFPVPRGWRVPFAAETLSRADVALRRSILAVVACLLQPSQFADLAQTAPHLRSSSRYYEILQILGATRANLLLSRAHRWPSAFRKKWNA